jgi:hypothetical protein
MPIGPLGRPGSHTSDARRSLRARTLRCHARRALPLAVVVRLVRWCVLTVLQWTQVFCITDADGADGLWPHSRGQSTGMLRCLLLMSTYQ